LRVEAGDRAEVDGEITVYGKGPAGDPRYLPLERALEPVPVERDHEGSDADQDRGAGCACERPYAPSAQLPR